MKKEITLNLIFIILFMIVLIGVVLYAYGYRPVSDPGEVNIQFIKTGALNIDTDGVSNKVYLNEDYVGLAPQRIDGLKKGKYAIRIERDNYQSFQTVVEVLEDTVIRITPTLIPNNFAGNKIFETSNQSSIHTFVKSSNQLYTLSSSGTTLKINILNLNDIQNTFRYFFPQDSSTSFSLNNTYISDISAVNFGLNDTNTFAYLYDNSTKKLLSIDLSSHAVNNNIDLGTIFSDPQFKIQDDSLYIYDVKKIYKYNFYSKNLSLKYNLSSTDSIFSITNGIFLINSNYFQVVSSNDSLNDSKKVDIGDSTATNISSEKIYKIGNTDKFLLTDSVNGKLDILSSKGEVIDSINSKFSFVESDALSILVPDGIMRFNNTSSRFVLENFKDQSFKWSNLTVVKIANKSYSILLKDTSNNYYISDLNLQKLVKIPLPSIQTGDSYEVIMDQEDELYFSSQTSSGKFTVYKY